MTGLRFSRVAKVLGKELREARRDRNLFINLVLVPLFLYPVLGFGLFQVFLIIEGMSERETTVVAVSAETPADLREALEEKDGYTVADLPADVAEATGAGRAAAFRTLREGAKEDMVQAALVWSGGGTADGAAEADRAEILFDSSRERSARARDELAGAVDEWNEGEMLAAVEAVGLTSADLDVWTVEEEDTASARQRGQEALARVLPLVLLLMLAQGTFYAALDTVVGERERGTLETLLTSPLARGEALMGKFLFVVTASVVALSLNLASLTIFLGFVLKLLGVTDRISVTVEPAAIGLILLTAVLAAACLAALFMIVSVPAKTYREGQATLTPLNLLIMVPGLLVSFDSGPFGMNHAAVPVLNAVALFKSVLKGEYPPEPILATLAVLAVASAAGLFFASRLVGREDVYFDPQLTLRRLLTGRGGGKP